MQTVTIPRKLAQKDDLVVIPRRDYESLLRLAEKKAGEDWVYHEPFLSELKKRIKAAKKELKQNKLIQWKKS